MSENHRKVQPGEGVVSCRDAGGMLVVDRGTGQSFLLIGFEAALWDWLQRFRWEELTQMAAVFLRIPEETAEVYCAQTLSGWASSGLIEVTGA